jgi:hypothetical protein
MEGQVNVWLPIVGFVIGTWCGFGVACLFIAGSQKTPRPRSGCGDIDKERCM